MISVVIPVYRSKASIEEVILALQETLISLEFEVLCVHDDPCEALLAYLLSLQKTYPFLRVIQHQENYGQQHALYTGVVQARGETIITMDDDLQHPPCHLPFLLSGLEETALIFGHQRVDGRTWYRRLGSWATDRLFTNLLKKPHQVKISSYRVFKRSIAPFEEPRDSFLYLSAYLLAHEPACKTMSISFGKRKYGKSQYNIKKLVKLYLQLLWHYGLQQQQRKITIAYEEVHHESTRLGGRSMPALSDQEALDHGA